MPTTRGDRRTGVRSEPPSEVARLRWVAGTNTPRSVLPLDGSVRLGWCRSPGCEQTPPDRSHGGLSRRSRIRWVCSIRAAHRADRVVDGRFHWSSRHSQVNRSDSVTTALDVTATAASQSTAATITRRVLPRRTGRIFVTETTELPTTSDTTGGSTAGAAKGGLSGMVLPDLKALAGRLGIKGTSGMRKGDLVAAIAAHQAGTRPAQQHPDHDRPTTPNGSAGDTPAYAIANGIQRLRCRQWLRRVRDRAGRHAGVRKTDARTAAPVDPAGWPPDGPAHPSLTPNRPSPTRCRPPTGQNAGHVERHRRPLTVAGRPRPGTGGDRGPSAGPDDRLRAANSRSATAAAATGATDGTTAVTPPTVAERSATDSGQGGQRYQQGSQQGGQSGQSPNRAGGPEPRVQPARTATGRPRQTRPGQNDRQTDGNARTTATGRTDGTTARTTPTGRTTATARSTTGRGTRTTVATRTTATDVGAAAGSGTATAAAATAGLSDGGRARGPRRRRAGARRRHPRRAGFLRVHPHVRLPGRAERRLRVAVPGPQERSAPRRRGHRRGPGAARGRACTAAAEVQRAGPAGHGQRTAIPSCRATAPSSPS